MKNKEKYAKQIVEVAIGGGHIAFDKTINKIVPCNSITCADCLFHGEESCQRTTDAWANAEYKEPRQFTETEKAFVKLFPEIKYITRDESGKLAVFSTKPSKDTGDAWWVCESGDDCLIEINSKNLLKFFAIKWEDEEPTSREEILRGSDE